MNGTSPSWHAEEPQTDRELQELAPITTDSANAEAFVRRYGGGFRWVDEWQGWLSFDGKRWTRTGARLPLHRAILRSVREDYADAKAQCKELREATRVATLQDDKTLVEKLTGQLKYKQSLLKWYEGSQNSGKIQSVAACTQPLIAESLGALDRDPWLLNVQNGTLGLRTATLRPHDRNDLLTQVSPVAWDERAKCPTWDAFLARCMGGNTKLVLYLQRLVGMSLTGITTDPALVFHYGHGANGKSTFLRAIQELLGEDYSCAAARDMLFASAAAPAHPTELARLYARRFVVCNEVPKNKAFDEAKIKDLTGDDRVSCRRMNEDWWDFVPTHKLHFAGNHKPIVLGDDLGIWRRIKLVPWLVTFAPEEQDRQLGEKLRAELPGILRWAAHGCLEWQRVGLSDPEIVTAAILEYRRDSDILGQFFDECCVPEGSACVGKAALREAYERWCKESGHGFPVGARAFKQRLDEMSIHRGSRLIDGRYREVWVNLRLKTVRDALFALDN